MRRKGWLATALVIAVPVVLIAASCSKKVVQSQATSTTRPEVRKEESPKAEVPKAEVPKAPDRSAENAVRPARPEEARPRPEPAPGDAAAREAAKWVFVNEHVHFAFGSSLLSDQARQILRGKANYLRSNPDMSATVEGHCDDRGTNAYNIALGDRRAEAVKTFLVDQGIGTNRLNTVSYGEERPVAVGHNETSWARNRRAQFAVD